MNMAHGRKHEPNGLEAARQKLTLKRLPKKECYFFDDKKVIPDGLTKNGEPVEVKCSRPL